MSAVSGGAPEQSTEEAHTPLTGEEVRKELGWTATVAGRVIDLAWLGEDSEHALTLGHSVDEPAFRRALNQTVGETCYLEDGTVDQTWAVFTRHRSRCEGECGGQCTEDGLYAWFAEWCGPDRSGALAVTRWSW